MEHRLNKVEGFEAIEVEFHDSESVSTSRASTAVIRLEHTDDDLETAKQAFMSTAKRFGEHMRKDKLDDSLDFDPNKQYSWQDVVDAMNTAERKYLSVKQDGWRGNLRDSFRKTRSLNGPVMSWLRLLPSESWQTSLLCGGLKVIVGVSGHHCMMLYKLTGKGCCTTRRDT